jgi:thioredoxin reductase/SAM-dependent methyltransferase
VNEKYDVVVVGGGAAGLAGALTLARARRSVLVIDAGSPRNAPAGHVHNYLGREGAPPQELAADGRAEVAGYGGEVTQGSVTAAKPVDAGGFRVTLDDGREVLVTTGLVDELPDVPGVAQRWGHDVLHCPYCHGWEVRDQAIGVLGKGPMSAHQALLWRQWSDDVILFRHTGPEPSEQERAQLAARGVRVVDGEVTALEVSGDRLAGVRLRSGEVVPRDAVVVTPTFAARADLLVSLGLETVELEIGGQVAGSYVPGDPSGATTVPGVWVAGNVANLMAQVITSAGSGLTAAAALNADLVQEDIRDAMAVERAGFDQQSWEERYRAHPAIWSGRPNPQLVDEVSDLPPGSALDAGCGEGADALWLAGRGWQVTAADFATTALERAAAHAEAAGLKVDWVHADLTSWIPPARFDLVSSHYLHVPGDERNAAFARLANAVAPGGTLLIVGHHESDLHTSMQRPNIPGMFFTAEEVAASLGDGWEIQVAVARPRTSVDPEGREVTIRDAILRARRAGEKSTGS